MNPKPWKIVQSQRAASYRVFTVRVDHAVSPRTGLTHDFYILESRPWVNVIALTEDEQVVLVQQYRHGLQSVSLEIPGGIIEGDDTPFTAAKRELREETGYDSGQWTDLGYVHPNPAIQDNRCHTFLARHAFCAGELCLDDREDIVTVLRPLQDIPRLIRDGEITHSLVIAAFYRFYMEYVPAMRPEDSK